MGTNIDSMIYRQNLVLGALLITLSELAFASMGAVVKTVIQQLPLEMVVFMRGLFGLLILGPLLFRRVKKQLATTVIHLHLLRAFFGLSAMYCFFYALANLYLADGMLLKMTSPIFMPLIAALWLKEGLSARIWMAVAIGFAGVVFILHPQGEFNRVALVGVAGGVFAAAAKVTVRRLSYTEPITRIVFYFTVLMTLLSALPVLWVWRMPGLQEWLLILLLGSLGTLGQLLLTRGYSIAAPSQVGAFTYFSVVFAAIYGYLFWDEVPGLSFAIGTGLIVAAGMIALRTASLREY